MQVRAKNTDLVNYNGQIFNLDPTVVYDGPFAAWLKDNVDVETVEVAKAAETEKPAPRKRASKG